MKLNGTVVGMRSHLGALAKFNVFFAKVSDRNDRELFLCNGRGASRSFVSYVGVRIERSVWEGTGNLILLFESTSNKHLNLPVVNIITEGTE